MSETLGSQIAALSALGYALAGQTLGTEYNAYRPQGKSAVIALPNLIASGMLADFPSDPATAYRAPSKFASPLFYGLIDTSMMLPGDYVEGARGTFFMVSQEPNVASMWAQCNRTLNAARPGTTLTGADPGVNPGYGATNRATETAQIAAGTALFEGWPASVLQGTRGERGPADLPGDPRVPWWVVLLPPSLPVTVQYGDQFFDDLAHAYTVSSAELTDLGWRITATQNVV
jgi:hypothetical protein